MRHGLKGCITIVGTLLVAALTVPLAGQAQDSTAPGKCGAPSAGVVCGAGNGRQTKGGGEKVPHNDGAGHAWPKISGILWQIVDGAGRTKLGGAGNDELLGHRGSDHLAGAGGDDVLWGDWDPRGNSTKQRDYLSGGSGNDWLYPSHGRSQVYGGAGRDYVWAYYGKGTINCGPGQDSARVRTNGAFKLSNCEKVRHFCSHGEDRNGNCLSPSGKPVPSSRRTR